jgi:hypothetical protein
MSFLTNSESGRNDFSSHTLTICLILIAYGFLGSLPLLIDLRLSGSDLNDVMSIEHMARILGKNRLLVHLLLPFVFIFAALYVGITISQTQFFIRINFCTTLSMETIFYCIFTLVGRNARFCFVRVFYGK